MKTNPVHESKPVINERYRDLTSTNECDFRVAETDPEIAALELEMTPGWNRTRKRWAIASLQSSPSPQDRPCCLNAAMTSFSFPAERRVERVISPAEKSLKPSEAVSSNARVTHSERNAFSLLCASRKFAKV
jgi:hypothetical protein